MYFIVPMTAALIPAAAKLEKQCFSLPWSEKMLLDELQNPLSYCVAAVGSLGELCGYAFMQAVIDEGYIGNVAVTPDARRMGVGSALIEALIAYGIEKKLRFLTLEVRAGNAPAIALYQKFGFAVVGRRKNYYVAPAEDALLMTYYYPGEDRC